MPTTAEAARRTTSRAGGSAAPRRFRTRVGRALRLGEHALAAMGALFLVYHLFFELSVVVSPSMSPTLQGTGPQNGDWVLMERASYLVRKPHRWEVVAFRNSYGTPVMKRVVGLPGEDVSLSDGEILINGAVTQRPASLAGLK